MEYSRVLDSSSYGDDIEELIGCWIWGALAGLDMYEKM